MITFLKRARLNFFKGQGFGKYLLYALGEIILVVTGILIALNVNNWNTEKKLEEQSMNQLRAVRSELIENMEMAETVRQDNFDKNLALYMVLADTLQKEDYTAPGGWKLRLALWNISRFSPTRDSYQTFISNRENLNQDFDFVSRLNYLNKTHFDLTELTNGLLLEAYNDERKNLEKNHEWYWKVASSSNRSSEEHIEYMLNDPFYKNKASSMNTGAMAMYVYMNQYRCIAENLVMEIDNIIGDSVGSQVSQKFQLDSESISSYLGTFDGGAIKAQLIQPEGQEMKLVMPGDTMDIIFTNPFHFYHFTFPDRYFEFKVSEDFETLSFMDVAKVRIEFNRIE